MNIPNILTLSRIIMIPVFVVIFYLPVGWSYLVSAAIFALAAATESSTRAPRLAPFLIRWLTS